MFIGHFAFAYVLISLFPGVPPLIPLLGVNFPDLLWPVLVLLGIEKVSIDPESPLQDHVKFTSYPYSHSLVLGTLIACVFGLGLAFFWSPLAGFVFVVASASHWLLDTTFHIKDLPVIGFGSDRKVGFGIWSYPKFAFIIELLFYAILTVLTFPSKQIPLLVIGVAFHLINANSFLGLTKKNPLKSANAYAILALVGILAFSLVANFVISGWK
ncbi:Uncharacterised protein [uncultured archaeon]|nr:Uncharacterised protein [uncultured archaeon]